MNTPVKIKKLDERAQIPFYSTPEAAGADVTCIEDVTIPAGETVLIKTGFSLELPVGTLVMLLPRSSLAIKKYLDMPQSVGIIDSDYRGEYLVALRNLGKEDFFIPAGERIAQMVLIPHLRAEFSEVDELSETKRGAGGFGSTGK
jgi:dUTP pyrophosphatase